MYHCDLFRFCHPIALTKLLQSLNGGFLVGIVEIILGGAAACIDLNILLYVGITVRGESEGGQSDGWRATAFRLYRA